MGTCQSQLIAASGDNQFVTKENRRVSISPGELPQSGTSPRKFTFGLKPPAPSSSSTFKNGFETTLISPAERTEATELGSPYASIFSTPYTPGTTDELMDIDDASSAAEEDRVSVQDGNLASHHRSDNPTLLLGDVVTDEEELDEYASTSEPVPFDEYADSNTPAPSAPLRVDTPAGFKTLPQSHSQSRSIKERFQTMMCSPRHDVADTVAPTTSLLAPPKEILITFDSQSACTKTSVNPKILASFNKLKTQARLAAKFEKKKKQKEKIEDRRLDIHGYKNLWEVYSGIQRKMTQQNETQSESRRGGIESISLNDSNTWFVDFGAIQAENHLDDMDVDDHIYEDDDNRSQASLSMLSDTAMQVQKRLFREKALERRRQYRPYSIGSKTGDLTSHRNTDIDSDEEPFDCRPQITASGSLCLDPFCAVSGMSYTSMSGSRAYRVDPSDNDDQNNRFTVDANASIVSDLDTSTVETTDYGVLHRYQFTSLTSTVLDLDNQLKNVTNSSHAGKAIKGTEAFFDAPTPKVQNNVPSSTASYMNHLCLPSVTIENSETGEVRWRKFPKTDVKAKTARKLDFYPADEGGKKDRLEHAVETRVSPEPERLRNNCITNAANQHYHDLGIATTLTKEHDIGNPPKIKTFDPVISTMSKEAFLRVSTRKSSLEPKTEFKHVAKERSGLNTSHNSLLQSKHPAAVATIESKKDKRELLARKVSSKIDKLVSQLYEDHAATTAST